MPDWESESDQLVTRKKVKVVVNLVDAVDISKCSCDGEHWADRGQGFVDIVHLWGRHR